MSNKARNTDCGCYFSIACFNRWAFIEIVATDGYDVKPKYFESFAINPGERYDFVLEAGENVTDYWIRVDSMEARKTVKSN